jgi:hypothetical protein
LAASLSAAEVPVGTYLYANPKNREQYSGSLKVTFASPGDKLVLAYGRKYRKDRKGREDTTEEERELFKPYSGKILDGGRTAVFVNLPSDYYDLCVFVVSKMRFYEGLELLRGNDPAAWSESFQKEVEKSLSRAEGKIAGWEAFFDAKVFNRFETDGVRGSILVQQMRLGKSFAESGDEIKGCIHSADICWVERAKVEDVGWQVVTRQQLYRDELESRDYFKHLFRPDLQGIRVGTKEKEIGPISLP